MKNKDNDSEEQNEKQNDIQIQKDVGKYTLKKIVGRGTFGIVYLG